MKISELIGAQLDYWAAKAASKFGDEVPDEDAEIPRARLPEAP